MSSDERKQLLIKWLKTVLVTSEFSCEPASSDASFRRYFRLIVGSQSYVVMDAPPHKEDCSAFISIAELLLQHEVNAPVIFYKSLEQGFLVLSDFGSISFLDNLNGQTVDQQYADAVQVLHKLHQIPPNGLAIANYDVALLKQEMTLFDEWFMDKLLGIELTREERLVLANIQQKLSDSATQQPQVFVHRDYHSRNLMLTEVNNPGVIDFQDAVVGPITYDLVSLYRDCYIDWPDEQIYPWLDKFLQQRQQRGCGDNFEKAIFYQWFDWMGVQRHMKAIGIFSRLLLRDGKAGYIKDIPRTLTYVKNVCERYDELKPLAEIMASHQVTAKLDDRIKGLQTS
ncbi:MAG: phosphotransferase [Gammaproteobacteria bacterium]|nr:phosphotransferase [Gammaproteobacteria bacterium]